MKISIKDCPAYKTFNVFGIETEKPCCYLYQKYCNEIKDCKFKQIIKFIKEKK